MEDFHGDFLDALPLNTIFRAVLVQRALGSEHLRSCIHAGTLKKVGCHTYESEKNQESTLKKSG